MPTSESALYPATDFMAGDILVVPFPYSDMLSEKRRPALVISSNALHNAGYLWVVMITSARQSRIEGDILLDDLAGTGLSAASVMRTAKIACIEPGRVIRKAGIVNGSMMDTVRAAFRNFLG